MLVQVLTWSCVCVVCARCVCGCDWLLWCGVFVLCVLRDEQSVSLRWAGVRWYVAVCGAVHAGPCGESGWQGLGKVGWDAIPLVPVSCCTIMIALPSC